MISEERKIDLVEDWADLEFIDKVAALRATITVPEVVELFGIEATEGDKIPSPYNPDERTPSCHLYDDHWFDYSTGKGGDIFDLVMILDERKPELKDAVRILHQGAVRCGKQYGDVETKQPRQLMDMSAGLTFQPVANWEGLDVRAFGLQRDGQGNIYVPHREPGLTYGVKVRYARGMKGSWAGSQYAHRLYDPLGWERMPHHSSVIICEGESDSWALLNVLDAFDTCDVLALPSGAGTWRDHWLDDLVSYNTVYVCMDNDRAGQDARDKLTRAIGWDRVEYLRVPQLFNDARAAIAAGWRPFHT